jgi:hypothetical protein
MKAPRGGAGRKPFLKWHPTEIPLSGKAGNRHISSAPFASPSLVSLTADVDPSTVLFQGRHDAASGTSRSPAIKRAGELYVPPAPDRENLSGSSIEGGEFNQK